MWWSLHHTNSERLKYGLCHTLERAATHKRAAVHLGPEVKTEGVPCPVLAPDLNRNTEAMKQSKVSTLEQTNQDYLREKQKMSRGKREADSCYGVLLSQD